MAKLRSGKNTNCEKIKKSKPKQNFELKEFSIKLKKMTTSEINSLLNSPKKCLVRNRQQKNIETQIVKEKSPPLTTTNTVSNVTANVIWKNITNRSELLFPTEIVLAKMTGFRPWPARINSVYRVGNVLKCYVLFYGTMQIGSVLRSQCVKIRDCDRYLNSAVNEIKSKFKWSLNYEKISETQDIQRTIAIIKLTQVQKFLLAVRDMERMKGVPYSLSMVRDGQQ